MDNRFNGTFDQIKRRDSLHEPTLACSEVVERLHRECFSCMPCVFDCKHAEAILHSWRERRVRELEELLRWFVAKSNHEGFCGQCPPVNPGTTCKCDWPEMKAKAEDALSRAQGK